LLQRTSERDTVVLREGLSRLFPADTSGGFDDLLKAIDVAEARQGKLTR
jgi:hypothetical protein